MPDETGFQQYRPSLFGLAYRMLGSAADAEDIVQEAYLRWQRSGSEVRALRPFLMKVVTHLCLDQATSARRVREEYPGTWLPEPVLTEGAPSGLEIMERRETISLAFLVLLQNLNPVERAVFLLRDVFDLEFEEIGEVVGKSSTNCRQIAHRARERTRTQTPRYEPSRERREQLSTQFARACTSGDLGGLVSLLTEDIVVWSDGGGKVRAALRPVRGMDRVARLLIGIERKFGNGRAWHAAEVNGEPGFVMTPADNAATVVALQVAEGAIQAIWIQRNPDKLRRLLEAWPQLSGGRSALPIRPCVEEPVEGVLTDPIFSKPLD